MKNPSLGSNVIQIIEGKDMNLQTQLTVISRLMRLFKLSAMFSYTKFYCGFPKPFQVNSGIVVHHELQGQFLLIWNALTSS
jgi:hypothetical protein